MFTTQTELLEMQQQLRRAGFDPSHAQRLADEGMGPHELAGRIRILFGVGSLQCTHGFERTRPEGEPMALGTMADGILAVIRCGLEQDMDASAFGGEERALVRRMARRGEVRIVREDRDWVYATLPDPVVTLADKRRGEIVLTLRDGLVIGAVGSEPERYVGLTEARARQLAEKGR